jgi:hypothetical protein
MPSLALSLVTVLNRLPRLNTESLEPDERIAVFDNVTTFGCQPIRSHGTQQ